MTAPPTSDAPTITPGWLLRPEPGLCPCTPMGRRRSGSFVEKTLAGAAGLLREVMFSEDAAARPGLLQRLDARVKLACLLAVLVALALTRHLPVLAVAYALTLALAAASRMPLGFFVRRVWLFVPLFTGVVVLPATLSFVTPGRIVLPLGTWAGQPFGLTAQGLGAAALIVARVACSISLVVLVTLTTPWTRLLAALGALGVPRTFVLVIGMAYRYVFALLGTVTDAYEARRARTVGRSRHGRDARAFLGASAGAVFGRAYLLTEEVHQAMLARGYRGTPRTLDAPRLTRADLLAAAAALAVAAGLIAGDVLLGR